MLVCAHVCDLKSRRHHMRYSAACYGYKCALSTWSLLRDRMHDFGQAQALLPFFTIQYMSIHTHMDTYMHAKAKGTEQVYINILAQAQKHTDTGTGTDGH